MRQASSPSSVAPLPGQEQYIAALERLNQQLALGWTPYSVTFTALAVLVAVLSIVGAIIIVYQGREYRALLRKTITDFRRAFDEQAQLHQAAVDSLLLEARGRFTEQIARNDEQLEKTEAKLDALREKQEAAPTEEKTRLERRISKLEKQVRSRKAKSEALKERVDDLRVVGYAPTVTTSPPPRIPLASILSEAEISMGTLLTRPTFVRCTKCNAALLIPSSPGPRTGGSKHLICPRCATINTYTH